METRRRCLHYVSIWRYRLRMETFTDYVARSVRTAINDSPYTVEDIVRATGIPSATMHRHLKTGDFRVIHLRAIANALDVDVITFFPDAPAA